MDRSLSDTTIAQIVDATTQWINHYSLDSSVEFGYNYPPDSDLFAG